MTILLFLRVMKETIEIQQLTMNHGFKTGLIDVRDIKTGLRLSVTDKAVEPLYNEAIQNTIPLSPKLTRDMNKLLKQTRVTLKFTDEAKLFLAGLSLVSSARERGNEIVLGGVYSEDMRHIPFTFDLKPIPIEEFTLEYIRHHNNEVRQGKREGRIIRLRKSPVKRTRKSPR